ncbi:MAG: hypothetical protein LC749_12835 [Actinobacteria bacterium]|nr:hypothetical protein [Actinomycetota bacterium]
MAADLGSRPHRAWIAMTHACRATAYWSGRISDGVVPAITAIWAALAHILSLSRSMNPRLMASARKVAAVTGSNTAWWPPHCEADRTTYSASTARPASTRANATKLRTLTGAASRCPTGRASQPSRSPNSRRKCSTAWPRQRRAPWLVAAFR